MFIYKHSIFTSCALLLLFSIFCQQASATAAFARATGASCKKCHTANFPRLNAKGERFMLNGYQLKKESETGGFALDDELVPQAGHKSKLADISEVMSVTGQFVPFHMNSRDDTPQVGEPKVVTIIATGSLAQDIPLWAGVDVDHNGASLHRYQIGKTNVAESTLINFRMGTIDPTTWTSFYEHSAALESVSSGIGAYGGGYNNTGFTTVGVGYHEKNALEYYGYTDNWLWSMAVSNAEQHDATTTTESGNQPLDVWLTAKYNFFKDNSVSLLWYKSNSENKLRTFTVANNLRLGKLDFLTQFSMDNAGGKIDLDSGEELANDKWGFTAQFNYASSKNVMGILRFDNTSNGEKNNSLESQLTLAMVFKPKDNIKITAAYVAELDSTNSAGSGQGHSHGKPGISPRHSNAATTTTDTSTETVDPTPFGDHFSVNIRYMF